MKLFSRGKDGGPESNVHGFWFIEVKSLFSIVLLRFDFGTREAFHSHAFNCISWIFKGRLEERHMDGKVEYHTPSIRPIVTKRETFHQVFSHGTTYVLSFRGPWSETWKENVEGEEITLTHSRVKI